MSLSHLESLAQDVLHLYEEKLFNGALLCWPVGDYRGCGKPGRNPSYSQAAYAAC